ncbi:hypothetical protein ACJ72_01877 [Emergomyces africanus]|uniref:Plastocyanin-like domain-containing protein n=1 Tax=Emergomyces africanus TaxID=1955775 RepID=A0A1B7P3Z4_9EURO|nr:hypothetical protein ACJ72_01877 [Emergomyces africanus]
MDVAHAPLTPLAGPRWRRLLAKSNETHRSRGVATGCRSRALHFMGGWAQAQSTSASNSPLEGKVRSQRLSVSSSPTTNQAPPVRAGILHGTFPNFTQKEYPIRSSCSNCPLDRLGVVVYSRPTKTVHLDSKKEYPAQLQNIVDAAVPVGKPLHASDLPVEEAELTIAPNVPAPITRDYPVLLKVPLTTTTKIKQLTSTYKYEQWTFNNQVPAPFIRARVGDVIELSLTNKDVTVMHLLVQEGEPR